MQRRIEAPDWEWGTREKAAGWLGVEKGTFDALLASGKIPPGVKLSRQAVLWHWTTIYAISVLIPWLAEMHVKPKSESELEETGGV